MGLDYASSAGADGASGNPDGDGVTNQQEQTAGSHPKGASREDLAEGADNAFFKTESRSRTPALRRQPPSSASTATTARRAASTSTCPRAAAGPCSSTRWRHGAVVLTIVERTGTLVAERTMRWDSTGYGSHAERPSRHRRRPGILAEGRDRRFCLFYLVQNPKGAAATSVTVRYLGPRRCRRSSGPTRFPPRSQTTMPVDQRAAELGVDGRRGDVTADEPIWSSARCINAWRARVVAGHESAGVTARHELDPRRRRDGPFFDLFVLSRTRNATAAEIEAVTCSPAAWSSPRRTSRRRQPSKIWVDARRSPGSAWRSRTSTCRRRSRRPTACRSLWSARCGGRARSGGRTTWGRGAQHARLDCRPAPSLGAGRRRGRRRRRPCRTYVLIANTSPTAGQARLTVLPELGTTPIAPSSLSPFPPRRADRRPAAQQPDDAADARHPGTRGRAVRRPGREPRDARRGPRGRSARRIGTAAPRFWAAGTGQCCRHAHSLTLQ